MSDRRRGLGRGLGALIPQAPPPGSGENTGASVGGNGSTPSPGSVPVLTPERERGVAAAAVTSLPEGKPRDAAAEEPREKPADTKGQQSADKADEAKETKTSEADAAEKRGKKAEDESGARAENLGEAAGAHFAEVPLEAITPNPRQPREVFDEDALAELVTSIKEVGLLQPVVLRQLGAERYELIMGERRWRACREAGLERIPAIVRATDDEKLLLDALLENLHRAQLNPLEEAAAYDQLLKDFNCTHDQLADRIGRSRPQVSNTLRLLKLSPSVQRRVAAGVLSAGHARALLSVEDGEEQDRLAHRIVAEGLSVRAVEEIVTMSASSPKSAKKAKGPRAGKRVSPALDDLAGRLSDRFETRVKVDLGQKKGKIVVEFASVDDLERILGQLAPGEGKVLGKELSEEGDDPEKAEPAGKTKASAEGSRPQGKQSSKGEDADEGSEKSKNAAAKKESKQTGA